MKKVLLLMMLTLSIFAACKKEDTDPVSAAVVAPNAFTPNGDGLNDTFKVSGRNISKFEIKIYDQNNLLIYNSKKLGEGWDGTDYNSGKPLPAGTYTYLIEYEDENGQKYKKRDMVELIR